MDNKKLLAIETSDHVCSVAISKGNTILVSKSIGNKLNHSKTLMPLIEQSFLETSFEVNDIDYIFVANGPGSFTGIRIGVATAKALAHFNNTPIITLKTLDNIASMCNEKDGIVVPLIDARRKTFYTAFYEGDFKNIISDIMHIEISEIISLLNKYNKDIYLIGDNLEQLLSDINLKDNFKIIDIKENIDRAENILLNAKFYLENNDNNKSYESAKPFYLKKSQAEREYDEKHGVE